MPAAKRRAPDRRTRRAKRRNYGRKSMAAPRRYLRPSNASLSIKRKFYFGIWNPNTTTVNGFWRKMYVQLAQVPNFLEFANLFDQYKINAVKYTLISNYSAVDGNNANPPATAINQKPTVHICYDKYSTVNPAGTYSTATFNTFFEQGRVKTVKDPFAPINIYVSKPTILQWQAAQATTGGAGLKVPGFLRTDNMNAVDFFGPQIFISDTNMAGTNLSQYTWDIYITVYLQCRNAK